MNPAPPLFRVAVAIPDEYRVQLDALAALRGVELDRLLVEEFVETLTRLLTDEAS